MRLTPSLTEAEVLEGLRREAEQVWGPERRDAQQAALKTTATAIWRVLQLPLDPLEDEPDFSR